MSRGVLDRVLPIWAASPGQSQTGSVLHISRAASSGVAAHIGEVISGGELRLLCGPHVPDWPLSSCI